MKTFNTIAVLVCMAFCASVPVEAQRSVRPKTAVVGDQRQTSAQTSARNNAVADKVKSSSASAVSRRSGSSATAVGRQQQQRPVATGSSVRDTQQTVLSGGVTGRMQAHMDDSQSSDADVQWMRVIYRHLDLNKDKNTPLYYPEEKIDGQENLFRIIMRMLADNQLSAYEYLDGREVFTDEYRIKVKEMLDRFQILYADAKGSTDKNPLFTIEESDVPSNEVLSYYILERWVFDRRENKMKTEVEAICPVLHRSGDFGGEAVKYPMFWVKMQDIRPYLRSQYIFTDDDNNQPLYTYDDYFTLNMYEGDIYKTRNLRNKSMAQLYSDPDDLKRAQDSIQNRLEHYADNLWVPTREEIIAAREAREEAEAAAAMAGDTLQIKDRDTAVTAAAPVKKSTRSSRSAAKKESKPKKVKESKPKATKVSSSGSASRSVRRRK